MFGSRSYAYVKASGSKYFGSHGGSTSTFEIPVALNANNTIIGMTTAMSQDHEITYTLYIYLAAADEAEQAPADENAPAIIGLEYQSTDPLEAARRFAIYRYQGGYAALRTLNDAGGTDGADYLLVPEGAEFRRGWTRAQSWCMPVKRAYVASDAARSLLALIGVLDGLENPAFPRPAAAAPDYAARC